MSPCVPTEELLLWATCQTHLSVTIGVVCISVPSCFVFRVESSVEQRDSPKGFLSWMNPPAWGTVGWKMQRHTGGKSALFYQAETKVSSVYHRLLCIAHVIAPIHLVLTTGSGCLWPFGKCPSCLGKAMLYLAKDGGETVIETEDSVPKWPALSRWDTDTEKPCVLLCQLLVSSMRLDNWQRPTKEGPISIDGSGDTTFHHGRKGTVVSPVESMVVGVCSSHSHQTRSRHIGPEVRPRYDFQSPCLVAFLWKLVPHDFNVPHPPQIATWTGEEALDDRSPWSHFISKPY